MCGISGLYCRNGISQHSRDFERSNIVVNHRGPDGHALAFFREVQDGFRCISVSEELPDLSGAQGLSLALGHRRLAIIDLTPAGAQPMSNSTGCLWITYNGEIYNYLELREELQRLGHSFRSESDTEVILEAYAEWGQACVQRFNGIWSFALADLKQKVLFCSRDRFGVKPFHYYHDGSCFVFGSEIKQVLCYSFVPRRANERAIYGYLAFGAVDYNEETFFSSIYKLSQGHNLVLNLRSGSIEISRYYQPDLRKHQNITYLEAAEEFRGLLADSVRLQLRSDVEVGSCLSGGLDSSAIVCLMNTALESAGKTKVQHTFSAHFDDEEANELEYMLEIIKATRVRADFVYPNSENLLNDIKAVVWSQGEPFGSTSIFSQWSVFKLVNQHGIKVMLDGQGSDEMLAGYVGLFPYYFRQLKSNRQFLTFWAESRKYAKYHGQAWLPLVASPLRRMLPWASGQSFGIRTDWINDDFAEQYKETASYLQISKLKYYRDADCLENELYKLTFITNLQALLRHEDRNSMAFSVESRVPFLDHRLVEFIFRLPSSFKIRDGYTKRVLRDAMRGILPEKIRLRVNKLGFATPERKWQRTTLRPLIESAVMKPNMRYYLHPAKTLDYYHRLMAQEVTDFAPWRWLNLSLWLEAYELG